METGTKNGFNLLRLVFSAFVLVAHAYPLGLGGPDYFSNITNGQMDFGTFGVIGFFSISGYLITQSASASTAGRFLWKRILRIYPGFWAALLFAAILLAPIIWICDGHPLDDYWKPSPDGPLNYLLSNFTTHIGTWGIYDIFQATTPWGAITKLSPINGSLWTLFWEVSCYLALFTIIAFGPFHKLKYLLPAIATLLFITNYVGSYNAEIYGKLFPVFFENSDATKFCLAFFSGASIWLIKEKIDEPRKLFYFSALLVIICFRSSLGTSSVSIVALTTCVITAAFVMPNLLKGLFEKNDYSYGLYLYAFPVQMTLAYFGIHKFGTLVFIAASLGCTFPLAIASWHLIEKKALKFKKIAFWKISAS
jgi:peptidoglycan/LPS O-acetylase OafA/YrhL